MKVIFNVLLNFTPPPSRNFHGKNFLAIFFSNSLEVESEKNGGTEKKTKLQQEHGCLEIAPIFQEVPLSPCCSEVGWKGGGQTPKRAELMSRGVTQSANTVK